ncbi:MAG: transposase [Chromatiales bacterium]|nr:transposase [Chromatiales bacterium]
MVAGYGIKLHQPGKPTQNAFIESLHGKYRGSCLNLHCGFAVSRKRTTLLSNGDTTITMRDRTVPLITQSL